VVTFLVEQPGSIAKPGSDKKIRVYGFSLRGVTCILWDVFSRLPYFWKFFRKAVEIRNKKISIAVMEYRILMYARNF
jgi:hypothetical protein